MPHAVLTDPEYHVLVADILTETDMDDVAGKYILEDCSHIDIETLCLTFLYLG